MTRVFDVNSINKQSYKCEKCSKPAALVFSDYNQVHLCCLDKECRPEACPELPSTADKWPIPCITTEHADAIKNKCCSDPDPDLPDLPTALPQFDVDNASDEELQQRLADIDWALRNTSVNNRLDLHRTRMITYKHHLLGTPTKRAGDVTITERNLLEESAKYIRNHSNEPKDKALCDECTVVASKFVYWTS